jgi:hydroxymethylpyrimidine/phosphomethylpyrimidine kinase / thiaminase
VLNDTDITAMKTGMLYDAGNTQAVVKTLRAHYGQDRSAMPPLVVDPVCVSTSGHELLHPDAVEVMVTELFPLAYLITPNRQEAEVFLSRCDDFSQRHIKTLEDMLRAARTLLSLGSHAVLVKGGHMSASLSQVGQLTSIHSDVRVAKAWLTEENMEILQVVETVGKDPQLVVDILAEKDGCATLFVRPRLESKSTHGTGCTLSAAIACMLSQGQSRKLSFLQTSS